MISEKSFTSSTMQAYIELGELDTYTNYNFSILEKLGNLELPIHNILEHDYLDELKSISADYELDDEEFRRYKYKPNLLAYDLYGNPELYFVILLINDMMVKKEFDRQKIKIIEKEHLFTLLNAIYNAQTDFIDDNRNNL